MNGVQIVGVCRICFEEKASCISLYDVVVDKYLPSVIEYCCAVQVSPLDEPNALVCTKCAVALIRAENVLRKFRTTNDILQETQADVSLSDLVEDVDSDELEGSVCTSSYDSSIMFSSDESHSGSLLASEEEHVEFLQLATAKQPNSSNLAENACLELNPKHNSPNASKAHTTIAANTTTIAANNINFSCDLCSFKSDFATYFRNHMMLEHQVAKPRIFKCPHCSEAYVEHRSLREHVAHIHDCVPRRLRFLCSDCGKGFGKQSHLVRHSYVHNPEKRPFRCEVCPMRFVNQSSVKRHMVASHSNVKPYGCEICGKSFGVIYGLQAHLKRVHCNKGHQCPNCQILFRMNKSLEYHLLHECRRA